MRSVEVTADARQDLFEIWRFIATDSMENADRVIADIRSYFAKLAEFPGMGHWRDELDRRYRVWTVHSYLIIYRPDLKPIQITRVISGFRDLNRISI